jgi:hypothetical protein
VAGAEAAQSSMEQGGEGAAAAAQPADPAPAPAAAAAEEKPKVKKAKKAETPLADLVKEDVGPWIRATELVLPIDLLHLDRNVQLGQIRPLKQKEVEALAAGFRHNPPTGKVKVVVWEEALDQDGNGVCV